MAIEFVCPTCNGTLRVGDESVGRVVRCGACRTMLRVPGLASEPDPAPAPPDPFDTPPQPSTRPRDSDDDRDAEPPAAAEPVERPRARTRSWDDADDRPRRPRDRDDDDDDRPRRRRRPPPPSGGRVLFWLALTAALVLFFTCGCCGGLYFIIPGPEWRKHESAKGGFKVDLPAPPRQDMEKLAGGQPDPKTSIEGTILLKKLEEFAVVYTDIPANERGWVPDKQRLDEAVKALRTDREIQSVLAERDITVGGFPAREVEFIPVGGGWCVARIVIADTRVYVLIAGGRFAKPGNENVKRFLDSFEITDPRLKKGNAMRPFDR